MAPDQEWKLDGGTAWIHPSSGKGIVKPLVLASKAGPGETDLAALRARLYSTTDTTTTPADPQGHLIPGAQVTWLLNHLA